MGGGSGWSWLTLQNKKIMSGLIPHIKTIAIFKSSRSVKIDGMTVDRLQPMVMVDGEIHKSGDNLDGESEIL